MQSIKDRLDQKNNSNEFVETIDECLVSCFASILFPPYSSLFKKKRGEEGEEGEEGEA